MGENKISAVVIGYNDEPNIEQCMESLSWADEIIFVDSFSTDKTSQIASKYTNKVFQQPFEGFGKLRNIAISYAANDWIFSLDTDERATPEIANEVKSLLKSRPDSVAYFVPRKNFFLGRWIKHCGWYPDYRQPQFFNRRFMRYKDSDIVHEGFEVNGKIGYLKEHVIQIPFRDTAQFLNKMEKYSRLMAIRMKDNGKHFSCHQLITHPAFTFLKMYVLRLGFLDGLHGFILSGLYAYYTYIKYVRLWEMTKIQSSELPHIQLKK